LREEKFSIDVQAGQSSHPRLGFIYIFAQIEENVADIAVAVQPIGCLTFAAASVLEFPLSHKML
jgi:hypothetical protein